jgi:neopullulanase
MTLDVKTPDWVKDAVFYQVFPDRFAFSTQVDKPHNLEPWDAPPTRHGFKGGDLYGVAEHLDYVQDLGVSAIYFNPIFQSTANHRYHTHDYEQVDPILGGNAAFKKLLDAAHARGMRIVLDGVFNHASRSFLQFNHAMENGKDSPYLDWFTFHGFPVHAYSGKANYTCWFNLPALPKLNFANPQVREFALLIAEHWVREGIDGWRLDVPAEIDDDEFWREFRQRVKITNPDAYIVGEIWHRADRWLKGDQFDAVMNYQFTRACLSFFIDDIESRLKLTQPESYGLVHAMDAKEFGQTLEEISRWYPQEITLAQMNLIDSHDTTRFLTVAAGDTSALRLAYLTMFTFPGAPTIYYGDEIGMEGGPDPDCRRAFQWDPALWNRDVLEMTKKLAALRKKYRALRRGEFASLYAQDRVYAFSRHLASQTIIVALNAGHHEAILDLKVAEGNRLVQEWTGAEIAVENGSARGIRLPPREGQVWVVL